MGCSEMQGACPLTGRAPAAPASVRDGRGGKTGEASEIYFSRYLDVSGVPDFDREATAAAPSLFRSLVFSHALPSLSLRADRYTVLSFFAFHLPPPVLPARHNADAFSRGRPNAAESEDERRVGVVIVVEE
ncbi:unnamed protein product [Leuciscus chuanchicus]